MPKTNRKLEELSRLDDVLQTRKQYRYVSWLSRDKSIKADDLLLLQRSVEKEITVVKSGRYLRNKRGNYRVGKAIGQMKRDLYEGEGCWLKPEEFREKYGMSRTSFWRLHESIKHHAVYKKTRSKRGRKQVPSQFQLMVLLAFLRTEGSGMNNRKGRNVFEISSGSVQKYRDRTVHAIVDTLYSSTVYWPDANERREIADRFFRDFPCFPNLVGVADGTLFPLAFKPSRSDYPDYHGRKHLYTLTSLIVNDDKRRIRYFNAGWAGSAHDDRVFSNSALCRRQEEYFSALEYILGDSAFSPRPYVVPAFKKPIGSVIGIKKEIFNKKLAKTRIISEHTIGMLKARWPFLRSIRFVLTEDKRSLENILKYITCCIILHNLLIDFKDEDDLEDFDDDVSEIDADNELNQPLQPTAKADTRRTQLFNYVMERFY